MDIHPENVNLLSAAFDIADFGYRGDAIQEFIILRKTNPNLRTIHKRADFRNTSSLKIFRKQKGQVMKKYILSVLYIFSSSIFVLKGASIIFEYAAWDMLTCDLGYWETMKPLWQSAFWLSVDLVCIGLFTRELGRIWKR